MSYIFAIFAWLTRLAVLGSTNRRGWNRIFEILFWQHTSIFVIILVNSTRCTIQVRFFDGMFYIFAISAWLNCYSSPWRRVVESDGQFCDHFFGDTSIIICKHCSQSYFHDSDSFFDVMSHIFAISSINSL